MLASSSAHCAARRFACERILTEDVIAELILKLSFVSITLASAAMRHRGADMLTIIEEEEEEGLLASTFRKL